MAVEFTDARHANHMGSAVMTSAATDRTILIADEFSRYPGGRFREDGPNSGEEFRDDLLVPALNEARVAGGTVFVELDGTAGYASSFVEEAFGGLVRERQFTARELARLLRFRAGPLFESYRILAERYIREARPRIPG